MKFKTCIFILCLFFFGCSTKTIEQPITDIPIEQVHVSVKPYSNPAMIFGSSARQFFQNVYRNNQYNNMLAFTASQTINKYGRETILSYYKINFKFDYVLGNLCNINTEYGVIILTYSNASIMATRRKVVIHCTIENDTVKVILEHLATSPFE